MKTFLKLLLILVIGAAIAGIILYLPIGGTSAGTPSSTGSAASSGIIISEVMSGNKGVFPDDKGNGSDWVELYNTTDNDVDMRNFALSDDEKKPDKWAFPANITLKAHGYLIVFLSGDSSSDLEKGIIHCTFKLSSQGEKLLLSSGMPAKTVDSVDIPALPDNFAYALKDGSWQQTADITPGYENSDAGYQAFKDSMATGDSTVLINEVMTSNAMTIKDDKGVYTDWVEIINKGSADVNLKGYGLSDNPDDTLKWRFPDVTVKAGQQLLVFCSGIATPYTNGSLYAGFKLSSYSSDVILSDTRGRVLDSVKIGEISSDWSYSRVCQNGVPTGQWVMSSLPTPGYPNTNSGFTEFENNNQVALGDIVISEILSSNNKIDTGNNSKDDFIEIMNRGGNAVNLNGYGLTDNASNPAKFRFPDVTLQPGQRITVLANDVASTGGQLSAPFKLGRQGTTVALFNAQDELLDRYFLGTLPENISIGRAEGSTQIAYFVPTFNQPNGEGLAGFVSEVQFDKEPGKYDGTIQLTLSSTEGSTICYTTDGSEPTQNSTQYTGPITVDKTMPVRAKAFKQSYIGSGTTTATYFINTSHTLPLISIVTKDSNLFDPNTGIYMPGPNATKGSDDIYRNANFQSDTEVPASFEVYDESGQRVFQQEIGLAMTGGLTLSLREQKSFAIYARTKYGKGTMAYPFFQNRNFTEYKSLILRTGGREGGMITKLNNYVALSLADGQMNVMTQAAKPCVLYIDGKYWGVYYLMEKRNKYMVAQHEEITDSSVTNNINLTKGNGSPVNNGSGDGYKEIFNYINNNDMTKKESFDWVAARMDTNSYMDFMINEIYIANNDPGNLQAYQIPPDGKWKQIYQDLDIAFYSFDSVKLRIDPQTPGSDFFIGLLKYKPWKDAFIERFAWALKNVYSKERVTAAIDDAANLYRGEVNAEHERWTERPTLDEWEAGVNGLKNFAKIRGKDVVNELKTNLSLTQEQIQMLEDAIK